MWRVIGRPYPEWRFEINRVPNLLGRLEHIVMRKCDVKTPEDALLYITDCCLATVAHMAMLKSRKKLEYERQISIAQQACDWIKAMGISPHGTRAEKIIGRQTVEEWARSLSEERAG